MELQLIIKTPKELLQIGEQQLQANVPKILKDVQHQIILAQLEVQDHQALIVHIPQVEVVIHHQGRQIVHRQVEVEGVIKTSHYEKFIFSSNALHCLHFQCSNIKL